MPRLDGATQADNAGRHGRMPKRLVVGLGLAVLSLTAPGTSALAQAQSQTQPGDAAQMQDLIKELNAQLQRGEDKRLIDPWFLKDLRQTIGKYDNPWGTAIFEDKFSSRGSQPRAPWQVVSGEFLVDWRYGMRSLVQPVAVAQDKPQATQDNSLGQLFGALLKQATKSDQQTEAAPAAKPTEMRAAEAIAPVKTPNAFAIRLELTTRAVEGVASPRFEFGPYQGSDATAGYRLALLPGRTPSLELTSVSSRGTVSTVELYDKALKLDDGQAHVFEWTRNRSGQMIVRVDGTQVMDVTDRRFTGDFDGLSVVNEGGDMAVRSVRIDGAS